MSRDLTDDKSTLVQATSHYLDQCWPRSMSPYGVTRPQWFKRMYPVVNSVIMEFPELHPTHNLLHYFSTCQGETLLDNIGGVSLTFVLRALKKNEKTFAVYFKPTGILYYILSTITTLPCFLEIYFVRSEDKYKTCILMEFKRFFYCKDLNHFKIFKSCDGKIPLNEISTD